MPRSLLFWRRPRIPVIQLHGLLAAREGALNIASVGPAIDKAFRAAGRKGGALVLDIDSPGGSPVQSELIAGRIRRRAEERGMRVHAVIQEVGASGGYWLACAADEIHANAMSIVGSIGVIGGGFGFPALLDRAGVERRLYTAGENKARLDPFSPERPQDVAFVHGLMEQLHARFKDWVRARRGSRLQAEEATLFDGSFWLGSRAAELGLIDHLGELETVVKMLGGKRAVPHVFAPRRRGGLLTRLARRLVPGIMDALLAEAEERMARPEFGRSRLHV